MGTYKFVRNISRGGFGVVDLVVGDDGKQYARKTFDPAPMLLAVKPREKLLARFTREVKIQKTLDPAYFVPVLDEDLSGASPWFIMPLASESYQDRVKANRLARAIEPGPVADILNAMEVLHRLGYVHRDLKPENVLKIGDSWLLSDFGLVEPPPEPGAPSLTSTHSAYGTKEYMAPEQATAFKRVKPAADVYSFGCILHDLAAERPETRTPFVRQSCNHPLKSIVEKCTELSPFRRFRTIADLRAAVMSVLASPTPAGAPPPSAEAARWMSDLATINAWDATKREEFVHYLDGALKDDRSNVLFQIDEGFITALHTADPDIFEALADLYCDWVAGTGFDFNFCDVLIGRLETFFYKGNVALRTRVALSTAELAASHNRWFVMRRLNAMCGKTLDADTAAQIAIEIGHESRVRDNFMRCVDRISQTIDAYHPLIYAALR